MSGALLIREGPWFMRFRWSRLRKWKARYVTWAVFRAGDALPRGFGKYIEWEDAPQGGAES